MGWRPCRVRGVEGGHKQLQWVKPWAQADEAGGWGSSWNVSSLFRCSELFSGPKWYAQNPDLPVCVQYGSLSSRVEIAFKGKVTYSLQKILVCESSGDILPSRKNFLLPGQVRRDQPMPVTNCSRASRVIRMLLWTQRCQGTLVPYKLPFSFSPLQGHLPDCAPLWKDRVSLGRQHSFPPICAYTKSPVKCSHITRDNAMPVPSTPTLHVGQGQREREEDLRHTPFT